MKSKRSAGLRSIDLFAHYTWQVPVQTVGSASNAAAAVNALVKHISDRHALPADVTLHTDNGPEFKQQFEAQIDPRIKVTHGPAYSSNSQGEVENANKIWRGVMRRLLHSKNAKPHEWSKHLVRVDEIMNARPNESIGWKTSAQVLHGTLSGDDELLQSTRQALLKRANARRGPSNVTAHMKFLRRRENLKSPPSPPFINDHERRGAQAGQKCLACALSLGLRDETQRPSL